MKKTIIALICLVASMQVSAQFSVNYTFGVGSYDMTDMKKILDMAVALPPAQAAGLKIVEDFPVYINHNLDIGYKMNNHEFGIKTGFMSTGGKIAVADHTGSFEDQLILNGFREGLFYKNYFYTLDFNNNQSLSFFGELSPAVIITQLKTKSKASLGNETQKTDDSHTLVGGSVLPQVGVRYNLTPMIGLHISAGYEFEFATKMSDYSSFGRVQWSGFRAGIGAGVRF